MPASKVEADLLSDRIESLSPRVPSTVTPDTLVGDALAKMANERIGCVMVVDGQQLVGIFSERDAVIKLNTDAPRLAKQPVSKYMTPNPETLEDRNNIAFALHKMNLGGYRHVPILASGELTGVISIREILSYLTDRIAVQTG